MRSKKRVTLRPSGRGLRPPSAFTSPCPLRLWTSGLWTSGALGVPLAQFIITVYATHTRTSSCRYELSRPIDAPERPFQPTQIWDLWETFNYHGSPSRMLVLFDRVQSQEMLRSQVLTCFCRYSQLYGLFPGPYGPSFNSRFGLRDSNSQRPKHLGVDRDPTFKPFALCFPQSIHWVLVRRTKRALHKQEIAASKKPTTRSLERLGRIVGHLTVGGQGGLTKSTFSYQFGSLRSPRCLWVSPIRTSG